MIRIEYPDKKPSIREENGKEQIFCRVRKRWVSLTPEEWVRQNLLGYLIEVMHYPSSLIAVEKQVAVADMMKRFDIVMYKSDAPFMVIECKEMGVPINAKTLDQVMRYNINLQADYFIISNGLHCYGFKKDQGSVTEIDQFPSYSS